MQDVHLPHQPPPVIPSPLSASGATFLFLLRLAVDRIFDSLLIESKLLQTAWQTSYPGHTHIIPSPPPILVPLVLEHNIGFFTE